MNFDVTVIGAGVVGLAVAAELSPTYRVLVLERNRSYGLETSSHNSGVIHSGIYYPPGSNKAELCVEGRVRLYHLAEDHGIPYRRTGKLVVATSDSEINYLSELKTRGNQNGVTDLEIITDKQAKAMEPHIQAAAALYCWDSGIIDQMALMNCYRRTALDNHAVIVYDTAVKDIERSGNKYIVTAGDDFVSSRIIVNSAGLLADAIAQKTGINVDEAGYRLRVNKGSYYEVTGPARKLVSRPVYPVPPADGTLGIHITIDMDGNMRLGPDSEIVGRDQIDYRNDGKRLNEFYESARKYFPVLEKGDIVSDMVGYRPQLMNADENGFRDFIISEESGRGLPGLINLIGIESPGMTAAPAIARRIRRMVERSDN